MASSAVCQQCQDPKEDTLHVLRDCKFAKEVCVTLCPLHKIRNFFSLGLKDWLLSNLRCREVSKEEIGWAEKFAVVCWFLWRWRNGSTFRGEKSCLTKRVMEALFSFEEMKLATYRGRSHHAPIT